MRASAPTRTPCHQEKMSPAEPLAAATTAAGALGSVVGDSDPFAAGVLGAEATARALRWRETRPGDGCTVTLIGVDATATSEVGCARGMSRRALDFDPTTVVAAGGDADAEAPRIAWSPAAGGA